MTNSTLCYIEKNDRLLMMHRTKKANDPNEGKWIGVGGKQEEGESPDECMLREVREETGLTPLNWKCRGVVSFISDRWEQEEMFVFTAGEYTGELTGCAEGELEWIEKTSVLNLDLWQGDRIFLELIFNDAPFFLLTLKYNGDSLVGASLNGTDIQTAV
ncbi:MAG: 8-oxo-dGTP diphosphatase [Clostridiales bacterium]|nr:8-oxo-dGTP diphosphatase [Clostridiales bacterium]